MHLTNFCVSHISSDCTWLPHNVDWGTDSAVQTLFETFYGKECATCHIKEGKFYLMFEGFYAVGEHLFSHCELIPIIFLTIDWALTYSIFNWCLILFFWIGRSWWLFFFFYKSLSSCWSIFQWAYRVEPCSEIGCIPMQKGLFISLIYFVVIMKYFFFCSLAKFFFLVWVFSSLAKQFALQIWTVDLFRSLLFLPSETHILYKYIISALAERPKQWNHDVDLVYLV